MSSLKKIERYQSYLYKSLNKSLLPSKGVGALLFILNNFLAPILKKIFPRLSIKESPCTVLLVLPDDGKIARFSPMVDFLNINGVSSKVHVKSRKEKFYKLIFFGMDNGIPFSLYLHSLYVNCLLVKYTPKIIMIVENAGVFPSVLRYFSNKKDVVVANIAHGVGCWGIAHSNSDVDYTLVFGQSTIDGLSENKPRIGSTKAIIAGSPFINPGVKEHFPRSLASRTGSILIAGQYSPSWDGISLALERSIQIISDFIVDHPELEFVVRKHPLDRTNFWDSKEQELPNLVVSRCNSLFEDFVGKSLVLHMSSNVSIEAGLHGIPSIAVDPGGYSTHLHHDRFLKVAKTLEELTIAFIEVFDFYGEYMNRALNHADYLLGVKSGFYFKVLAFAISIIESKEEDLECQIIEEKL
ncbi:hypothetical protein NBRC116494_25270 [Aurantivibrio plasticivorans]